MQLVAREMTHAPAGGHIVYKVRHPETPLLNTSVLSRWTAMSLQDSFVITPEDSRVLVLNVSRVFWDSTGEQQRYNIWLPGIGIAAVYGLIIVVGLVGNVTLMKTCLSVKSMRTVPNLFLSSLALGDLLLLVTCAPVDASRYLVDEWLFGRVGCKLIPFIQLTSVGVSVFTLTALSADRYFSRTNLGMLLKVLLTSLLQSLNVCFQDSVNAT